MGDSQFPPLTYQSIDVPHSHPRVRVRVSTTKVSLTYQINQVIRQTVLLFSINIGKQCYCCAQLELHNHTADLQAAAHHFCHHYPTMSTNCKIGAVMIPEIPNKTNKCQDITVMLMEQRLTLLEDNWDMVPVEIMNKGQVLFVMNR